MSQYESPENPLNNHDQFEISHELLTAEERCLTALFDMADVDKVGAYQPCGEFFAAFSGYSAPDDLMTILHPSRYDAENEKYNARIYPEGAQVIATVSVGFKAESDNVRELHNIDFVQTDEGLRVYEKDWYIEEGNRVPKYVAELDETLVAALTADANKITQTIIDIDTERLKLGVLVEDADPDGLRRFHVGDILSVTTGTLTSARGLEGLYDILRYMTDDPVYSTQLGRFIDECQPLLCKQFDDKLSEFYELPPEALTDAASGYRWLGEVARKMGDPFLTVIPATSDQHASIDPHTELELDHGSDYMDKVIGLEPEESDEL